MIRTKALADYCTQKLLQFEIDHDILLIEDYALKIVDNKTTLFDKDWKFVPPEFSENSNDNLEINGYVYEFGGRWFIQEWKTGLEEIDMQELVYIGKPKTKIPMDSFIGIHSGNELLNGCGTYKKWIRKAKFLGIKNLGICEKNTLAGVIDFQNQCEKNDIKSIIGMTLSVDVEDLVYDIKLYAKNLTGWLNLLELNKIINVDEKTSVTTDDLMAYQDGLIMILDPKTCPFKYRLSGTVFYQLDTVIFENEDLDKEYVNNLEKYLQSDMQPIAIYDAYYLEPEDWRAREVLWGMAKKFDYKTRNQYFKSLDEYAKEMIQMFDSGDKSWVGIFHDSISNLSKVVDACNFKYDTVNRRLPKYKMTEKEAEKFDDNEQLFLHYIKQGFTDRKISVDDSKKYIERLKVEIDVLKKGDVIDYFLITRDFIQQSHDLDILVGIGRGSAGGSLVSWLLGIIQINPMDLDLLFERFLNEGRMGKMTECEAFKIKTNSGEITLNEGTLVKVQRDGKIQVIQIEYLKLDDEIINYN